MVLLRSDFLLHFSLILLLAPFHVKSHMYWDAQEDNVSVPTRFLIDRAQNQIILAAKNSVCHLGMDLQGVVNNQDVSPSSDTFDVCENTFVKTEEECQNYHYVLLFPASTDSVTIGNSNTPISDTILLCGTNAYDPQCQYRLRSDLTIVHTAEGDDFVPYDRSAVMTSLWTSSGRLVSGSPLDHQPREFGIAMSESPYTGVPAVETKPGWFNKSPQYVSMYEIEDYIYTFFREEPIETTQKVLYTRVSRLCKNDMGVVDASEDFNVFVSFLKARMSCVSGGSSGDIPYHYNELQDTFLVESGSYDGISGSTRHLYAVFAAPENGPVGSAVCVYTFGPNMNDLDSVFRGNYLRRTGLSSFETVSNPTPLTCETSRTLTEADELHLMQSTAIQANRDTPVVQLTGYLLSKIAVNSVEALDGSTREVMFIAGSKEDSLVLIKATYDANEEKHHIIWEEDLHHTDPEVPRITQIEIFDDSVYVGTTSGLYKVPAPYCDRYQDCHECVAARDPYCAYDRVSKTCVAVSDQNQTSASLVQDLVGGDVGGACLETTDGTPTPQPTTTSSGQAGTQTSGRDPTLSTDKLPSSTSTPLKPDVPTQAGLSSTKSSTNHLGTILGTVFGFVGGVALGIVVMAIFYNRRKYVWNKYLVSGEEERLRAEKEASASNMEHKSSGANHYSKQEEFDRNNSDANMLAPVVHRIQPTVVNLSDPPQDSAARRSGRQHSRSPPPYTPTKPSPIPTTGSSVALSQKSNLSTPHSTPSHKGNADTPSYTPHSTPSQGDVGMSTPRSAPARKDNVDTPTRAPQTTPSHKVNKDPHTTHPTPSLSTPSLSTPTSPPAAPLALSLTSQPKPRPPPKPSNYTRSHSYTTPSAGPFSTLPHKKTPSHSAATPPQRPSSAQNLHSCSAPTRSAGSPFATPTAGTPVSTSSSSPYRKTGPVFQFPPTRGPPPTARGPPPTARGPPRNPNVKAMGKTEEPTTNQERERYGRNMAALVHTIDRKNKLPNGHTRTHAPFGYHAHPHTTVVEIHDGFVGCSDC